MKNFITVLSVLVSFSSIAEEHKRPRTERGQRILCSSDMNEVCSRLFGKHDVKEFKCKKTLKTIFMGKNIQIEDENYVQIIPTPPGGFTLYERMDGGNFKMKEISRGDTVLKSIKCN